MHCIICIIYIVFYAFYSMPCILCIHCFICIVLYTSNYKYCFITLQAGKDKVFWSMASSMHNVPHRCPPENIAKILNEFEVFTFELCLTI